MSDGLHTSGSVRSLVQAFVNVATVLRFHKTGGDLY
jgi:hypothetical protein